MAAGLTPASCRLASKLPCTVGPRPVSISNSRCPVRTSRALTLSVIRSVDAPAARSTAPVVAGSTPTPKVLPSLGTTYCASCRDVSFSFPTLNECAAGRAGFGPNSSAALTPADRHTLMSAATQVIPRITDSIIERCAIMMPFVRLDEHASNAGNTWTVGACACNHSLEFCASCTGAPDATEYQHRVGCLGWRQVSLP